MRRAAKVDANQAATVHALRAAGASVAITSAVGGGFPDIVAGVGGHNFLLEIKDGAKPRGAQALTDDQVLFHARWRGNVVVVNSVAGALLACGLRIDAERACSPSAGDSPVSPPRLLVKGKRKQGNANG